MSILKTIVTICIMQALIACTYRDPYEPYWEALDNAEKLAYLIEHDDRWKTNHEELKMMLKQALRFDDRYKSAELLINIFTDEEVEDFLPEGIETVLSRDSRMNHENKRKIVELMYKRVHRKPEPRVMLKWAESKEEMDLIMKNEELKRDVMDIEREDSLLAYVAGYKNVIQYLLENIGYKRMTKEMRDLILLKHVIPYEDTTALAMMIENGLSEKYMIRGQSLLDYTKGMKHESVLSTWRNNLCYLALRKMCGIRECKLNWDSSDIWKLLEKEEVLICKSGTYDQGGWTEKWVLVRVPGAQSRAELQNRIEKHCEENNRIQGMQAYIPDMTVNRFIRSYYDTYFKNTDQYGYYHARIDTNFYEIHKGKMGYYYIEWVDKSK